jgi:hypothetical protein
VARIEALVNSTLSPYYGYASAVVDATATRSQQVLTGGS